MSFRARCIGYDRNGEDMKHTTDGLVTTPVINIRRLIVNIRWNWLALHAAVAIAVFPGVLSLSTAQSTSIEITIVQRLDFGDLVRSRQQVIPYLDPRAAQIVLEGTPHRGVMIAVERPFDLTKSTTGSALDLQLTPDLIGYSTDGGLTWSPFTSAALTEYTRFPEGVGTRSRILLRVGGIVSSESDQQRGLYGGQFSVTARYLIQ